MLQLTIRRWTVRGLRSPPNFGPLFGIITWAALRVSLTAFSWQRDQAFTNTDRGYLPLTQFFENIKHDTRQSDMTHRFWVRMTNFMQHTIEDDHDGNMNIFWKCQTQQHANQPSDIAYLFAG